MRGCRRARVWIERFLEQELSLEDDFRLEDHLRDCARCRAQLERGQQLEEALLRLPEPAESRLDLERSLAVIRGATGERVPQVARPAALRLLARPAAALPAAAAAALLAIFLVTQRSAPEPEPIAVLPGERAGGADGDATPERDRLAGELGSGPAGPMAGETKADDGKAEAVGGLRELERARLAVGRHLSESLGAFGADAAEDDVLRAVASFDRSVAGLRAEGWPLIRIAERLLWDDDESTARAAAHYLGRRGDALSAQRLEGALSRGSSAPTVVRSLGQLGPAGYRGLTAALAYDGLRDEALTHFGRFDPFDPFDKGDASLAAAELERHLHRTRGGGGPDAGAAVLAALASLGEQAVPSILRLAEGRVFSRLDPLEHLERCPGAGQRLARICRERPDEFEPPVLLSALARVQPAAGLDYVRERCYEREFQDLALACLRSYTDTASLGLLLELRSSTRLRQEVVDELSLDMVRADSGRLAGFAGELLGRGDVAGCAQLLDLLVSCDSERGLDALAALANDGQLSSEERRWALIAIAERPAGLDVAPLQRGLLGCLPDDRLLASAYCMALYAQGGEAAVWQVIGDPSERAALRILGALERAREDGRTATALFRVAREIEPVLALRGRDRWRSAP